MRVKQEKGTERQTKSTPVGLAAQPVSRIRTAEGWRRSHLRKHKLTKVPVKK